MYSYMMNRRPWQASLLGRFAVVISAALLSAILASPTSAAIIVSAGFEVDRLLSPLPGVGTLRVEAIRNTDYGSGVLYAYADTGKAYVVRVNDSGATQLSNFAVPKDSVIADLRFDTSGVYGGALFITVHHANDDGRLPYQSDLWSIKSNGGVRLHQSFGIPTKPSLMRFDMTDGSLGFRAGMYMLDGHNSKGVEFYALDASLNPSLVDSNLLPSGRADMDPAAVEFDPTGTFDDRLLIADSDDHDQLTTLFALDHRANFVELQAPKPLSRLLYMDMTIGSGGALGKGIYVCERVGDELLIVDDRGTVNGFARGFDTIESVSMGPIGDVLYVSDAKALYRIRESTPIQATIATAAVSVGVGANALTGVLFNTGQSIVGFARGTFGVGYSIDAGLIAGIGALTIPTIPGDIDNDRTIDLDDTAYLAECLAGPGDPVPSGCSQTDLDSDGETTMRDVALMHAALTD